MAGSGWLTCWRSTPSWRCCPIARHVRHGTSCGYRRWSSRRTWAARKVTWTSSAAFSPSTRPLTASRAACWTGRCPRCSWRPTARPGAARVPAGGRGGLLREAGQSGSRRLSRNRPGQAGLRRARPARDARPARTPPAADRILRPGPRSGARRALNTLAQAARERPWDGRAVPGLAGRAPRRAGPQDLVGTAGLTRRPGAVTGGDRWHWSTFSSSSSSRRSIWSTWRAPSRSPRPSPSSPTASACRSPTSPACGASWSAARPRSRSRSACRRYPRAPTPRCCSTSTARRSTDADHAVRVAYATCRDLWRRGAEAVTSLFRGEAARPLRPRLGVGGALGMAAGTVVGAVAAIAAPDPSARGRHLGRRRAGGGWHAARRRLGGAPAQEHPDGVPEPELLRAGALSLL